MYQHEKLRVKTDQTVAVDIVGTRENDKEQNNRKNQQYNFQIFLNITGLSSLAVQTKVKHHCYSRIQTLH